MVLEDALGRVAGTRLTPESLEPAEGQALLRILIGCTANDVTFGCSASGWASRATSPRPRAGLVSPRRGIAEVTAVAPTRCPRWADLGCFPMATDILLTPRAAPFSVVGAAETARR